MKQEAWCSYDKEGGCWTSSKVSDFVLKASNVNRIVKWDMVSPLPNMASISRNMKVKVSVSTCLATLLDGSEGQWRARSQLGQVQGFQRWTGHLEQSPDKRIIFSKRVICVVGTGFWCKWKCQWEPLRLFSSRSAGQAGISVPPILLLIEGELPLGTRDAVRQSWGICLESLGATRHLLTTAPAALLWSWNVSSRRVGWNITQRASSVHGWLRESQS